MITFDHVRQALALRDFDSATAQQRMAPAPRGRQQRDAPPKRAAVLILLYQSGDDRLRVVLTLRNPDLRGHSGQVSFPGGQMDPRDPSPTHTALRETREEIGISADALFILGELPRFYIPASHYDVSPIVVGHYGIPAFELNPDEVAAVFNFTLEDLLQPRFKRVEQRLIRGYDVRVPYYDVQGHKVWGATAMMLSELEARLRQILPDDITLVLD
ncbi:MAG: CoA pyrophosphatase [Chloroflexi bacterium]|nr:CoA pyrophosphatase [Chloroflexota bacterium]